MFEALQLFIKKFIPLSNEEWELLQPHLSYRSVKKNELFAQEGKICKEIGFILEGNMRHFYTHNGEEKTTYFYFENSFVTDYISCITD